MIEIILYTYLGIGIGLAVWTSIVHFGLYGEPLGFWAMTEITVAWPAAWLGENDDG